MVRDVRTSGLAGMERGDGTSCLNVCSCGRGDTSRSGDTTGVGAAGRMPRFVGALALAGEAQRMIVSRGGEVASTKVVTGWRNWFITARCKQLTSLHHRLRQAAMMHRQLTTVSRHGEPQSRSNHACSALLGRSGPCLTIIRRPPPPAMSTRSERRHKGGRGQCTCRR